jgi:beta-lactamase regulating signal transducer with metallopeptidase domain
MMAVQAAQSALLAWVLSRLLADVSRGTAPARHRMVMLAFWACALAPAAAVLPGALVVTWGADAKVVLTLRALPRPELSAWDGAAAVVLAAVALVTIWRLGRTVQAVVRAERIAKACVALSLPVKVHTLTAIPEAQHLRVVVHDGVPGPMTVGLLRPVVLVPAALVGSPDLDGYLRHEAVHLRLGHLRGALMQRLAEDLCCWNPALRALGRMLAEQRELVCDAEAAQERPKAFAAGLVRAARAKRGASKPAFGLGLAEASMARRVQRLLRSPSGMPVWTGPVLAVTVLIAVLPAPRRDGASVTRLGLGSTPIETR